MKKSKKKKMAFSSIVGIVLCVLLLPILIVNITIVIKGAINPNRAPTFLGFSPLIVETGSMDLSEEGIRSGDLIVVKKVNTDKLEVNDIISFMTENENTVVTHRIENITIQEGKKFFITKGDSNNSEDLTPVAESNVIGLYNFRIPKMGKFAMFLQKPLGMLCFIGVPVGLFIAYDILRRCLDNKKPKSTSNNLEEEILRLKKIIEEKEDA